MTENDKLQTIRELLESLSEEEKAQFISDLAENDELMASLLNILVQRNQAQQEQETSEPSGGEEGYVNFLRKVKG